MASFNVQPVSRFAGSSSVIRRPKEIACFSYDDNHNYSLGDASLRYYYPPRLGADLSQGFESFKKLDDSMDSHLDSLLKTIIATEREAGKRIETDIITWRGMMTKIMATPYDNFNGFEMNATLFEGTIYIEENHDFKREQWQLQQLNQGVQSQGQMTFWGYKFETLCLLENTWANTPRETIDDRENAIVNNHAQYCSIVKTGIGKNRLILGGEVDGVWDSKPAKPDQPINWIELKTSEEIQDRKGVPKIIVGFRSKNGILQRIEEIETAGIPSRVRRAGNVSWDGNTCINFTSSFLEWLRNVITTDGVWRIRRMEKSSRVDVYKVEESGYGSILSPDFIDWRKSLPPYEPAK